MYFTYGEKELDFLRQKDKRLAEVIDRIGPVHRTVDTDLFSAVVHHIIGQQISTKAQATIWQRMCDALGTVHAKTVLGAGVEGLQALGISCKKAEYITDFAQKVLDGSFDIEAVWSMPVFAVAPMRSTWEGRPLTPGGAPAIFRPRSCKRPYSIATPAA